MIGDSSGFYAPTEWDNAIKVAETSFEAPTQQATVVYPEPPGDMGTIRDIINEIAVNPLGVQAGKFEVHGPKLPSITTEEDIKLSEEHPLRETAKVIDITTTLGRNANWDKFMGDVVKSTNVDDQRGGVLNQLYQYHLGPAVEMAGSTIDEGYRTVRDALTEERMMLKMKDGTIINGLEELHAKGLDAMDIEDVYKERHLKNPIKALEGTFYGEPKIFQGQPSEEAWKDIPLRSEDVKELPDSEKTMEDLLKEIDVVENHAKPLRHSAAKPVTSSETSSKKFAHPIQDRSRFKAEIEKNPNLLRKMAAMVMGEVSMGRDPVKERIQLISAFNRAAVRGHSLSQALLSVSEDRKRGYYASDTYRRLPTKKDMDYFMKNLYEPVMAGADDDIKFLGAPVTGNASTMAYAGRRLAQGLYAAGKWYSGKPGVGEMFVTEKADAIRLAKRGIPVKVSYDDSGSNIPIPRPRPTGITQSAGIPQEATNIASVPDDYNKAVLGFTKGLTSASAALNASVDVSGVDKGQQDSVNEVLSSLKKLDKEVEGGLNTTSSKTKPQMAKTISKPDQIDLKKVAEYLRSKGIDPEAVLNK